MAKFRNGGNRGYNGGNRGGAKPGSATPGSCKTPTLVIVMLVALCAIALGYLVYILLRPASASSEAFQEKQKWELVLLTMKGCGWCEKLLPTWESYTKTYERALSQMNVEAKHYERSQPEAAKYEKWVKGYPTLLMVSVSDPDKVHVFEGQRTPEGIMKFVKSHAMGDFFTEPESEDDDIETNVSKLSKTAKSGTSQSDQVYANNQDMQKQAGMPMPKPGMGNNINDKKKK